MRCGYYNPRKCVQLTAILIFFSISAFGQTSVQTTDKPALIREEPAQSKGPINLDRELEEPVAANRALSYYHYAMAKLYEDRDDLATALSEMRIALKYNNESAAVHLEMAALLLKTGNIREAEEYARDAERLDPQDPDPHWFLIDVYIRPRGRRNASAESLRNAVQELEKLKELTPEDERVYYFLGGAHFELNEPEKAIEAYEKYQSLSPNNDIGYREIARYYNRRGDVNKAIEYLLKGLDAQPNSSDSLYMLGDLYSKINKNKEAISVFKKLLDITPHKMAIGHDLANLLFKTGEYNETVDVLSELIKAEPNNRAARILLGRAQIGLRRIPEAIETFQSLVEMDPGNMEAQFYLGIAYEQGEKCEDAASIFLSLLEKSKANTEEARENRPVFQQHLAACYIEMGEYEKAIALYQEMIGADSEGSEENHSVLRQHLAYTYMEIGEYEKAIALYREMVKTESRLNPQLLNAYRISRQFEHALPFGKELYDKDPDNIQIGLQYAQTLADAGQIEEGAEIILRLLESKPQEINLHIALSQLYIQGKRYEDAETILRQAEEKNLNDGQSETLKFNLAALYERKKDYDRAEYLFKDILKANPQNASVLNYIGYMLADRGVRLEEALEYVKKALDIDPNNGAYLDSLGWAFFKLNDMENAEKYLLEADKMVRNDPVIDEHLGDLYFKTGDLQKAHDFWMKSASIATEPEDIQKVRRKLEKLKQTLQKQKSEK